jgi:hypothetical protein
MFLTQHHLLAFQVESGELSVEMLLLHTKTTATRPSALQR